MNSYKSTQKKTFTNKSISYIQCLYKNRLWILLWATAFLAWSLFTSLTKKPKYTADLIFQPEASSNSSLSEMKSLKALIKNKGSDQFGPSPNKAVQIARSLKIITPAIFEQATIKGKTDFLANHIIRIEKLHKKWASGEYQSLNGFLFTHTDRSKFSRTESQALSYLYAKVAGNEELGIKAMLKTNTKKKAGLMALSVKSRNEALSKALSEAIFKSLDDDYFKRNQDRLHSTKHILETELDSLQRLVNTKDLSLARFQDTHKNMVRFQEKGKGFRLQRDLSQLQDVYTQVYETMNEVLFELKMLGPSFKVIDHPILPLKRDNEFSWSTIFMTGLLGGAIASLYFIAMKYLTQRLKR